MKFIFGSNSKKFFTGSPRHMYNELIRRHTDHELYRTTFPELPYTDFDYCVVSHGTGDIAGDITGPILFTGHGTPSKYPRWQLSSTRRHLIRKLAERTKYWLAASYHDAASHALMWFMDPEKMILTGFPRNDGLLNVEKRKRVSTILYAPTYRMDGKTRGTFPIFDFDTQEIHKFLEAHDMKLLIRKHPNDRVPWLEYTDRIRPFDHSLHECINTYLPFVDILITDYSTIAHDFLLLDRPIIYTWGDHEGFTDEWDLMNDEAVFYPGPKVNTWEEMRLWIEDYMEYSRSFELARKRLKNIMHSHQTNDSVTKIMKVLEE